MSNPVIQLRKINDKTGKALNFDEICSDDWDDCDSCKFEYEPDQDYETHIDGIVNVNGIVRSSQLEVTDHTTPKKHLTKSVNFDQVGGIYNGELTPQIVV